ncbi:MAG: hypothetical protein ACO3ZW_09330 [Opitutales bacterium]|jgi:hypothetical protein
MKIHPGITSILAVGIMAAPLASAHFLLSTYEGYGSCKGCHDNMTTKGKSGGYHPDEMMASIHWTWETTDSNTANLVGKKNVINNACVAVACQTCTSRPWPVAAR